MSTNQSSNAATSATPLRLLYVTSQWATAQNPEAATFVIKQVEHLRQLGVAVDVFNFEGHWSVSNYARAILRFRKHLRESHYDVIHARNAQGGFVAVMQRRLPVIVTYGGSDVLGTRDWQGAITLRGRIQQMLAYWVSRRTAANIVVAPHLAEALGDPRAHTIPDGVDMTLFRPDEKSLAREKLGIAHDHPIVLFLGDPEKPIKRYGLAKEAVQQAQAQMPTIQLVSQFNRPFAEIPVWMNASDVLLVTSSSEGSPNVVKEALACNLPVVSTCVGDVEARLGGIEGCYVCQDDSPEVIARALVQALSYPIEIAGRSSVELLSLEASTQNTIAIFHQILNGEKRDRKRCPLRLK